MQVLVKYLGGLSLITRIEQELVQPRDDTLGSFLLELANRKGKAFQQEIFNPGTTILKDFITIVLNGRVIPHDALLVTKIVDGDEIAWLPPILGG
jgi:molybdopterin converting factor small subunit